MNLSRNVERAVVVAGKGAEPLASFFGVSAASASPKELGPVRISKVAEDAVEFHATWSEVSSGFGSRFFWTKLKTMSFRVTHYKTCVEGIEAKFAKPLPQTFEVKKDARTVEVNVSSAKGATGFCLEITETGPPEFEGVRE